MASEPKKEEAENFNYPKAAKRNGKSLAKAEVLTGTPTLTTLLLI
jgi:hypothetical protein